MSGETWEKTPAYVVNGDGVYETSMAGTGSNSFNKGYSYFPATGTPFFGRGGTFGNGDAAGVFAFRNYGGFSLYGSGFRAVLV